MLILVTGTTGFLGGAFINRLLDSNNAHQAICPVRNFSHIGNSHLNNTQVEYISCDFSFFSIQQIIKRYQPEIIINFAAAGVNRSARDLDNLVDGNIVLPARLLQAAASTRLSLFIHVGSCSEYGANSSSLKFTEEHPVIPRDNYGITKAAGGFCTNMMALSLGIPFILLRPFTIYGVGEAPYRLASYIINRLKNGETVDLTSGDQVRDFLYVADFTNAVMSIIDNKAQVTQHHTYNICSGIPVKIRDVALQIASMMNKPEKFLKFGERPLGEDEPLFMVGDPGRLAQATGWHPEIELEAGIRLLVEQCCQNS